VSFDSITLCVASQRVFVVVPVVVVVYVVMIQSGNFWIYPRKLNTFLYTNGEAPHYFLKNIPRNIADFPRSPVFQGKQNYKVYATFQSHVYSHPLLTLYVINISKRFITSTASCIYVYIHTTVSIILLQRNQ